MGRKNSPKRDGSGRGVRANQGRGGCPKSEQPRRGKGRNRA